jgi:hypothetical protein
MNFTEFVGAIDSLVWKWMPETGDSETPRDKLKAIFDRVREEAVHELAETQRKRDKAMLKLQLKGENER